MRPGDKPGAWESHAIGKGSGSPGPGFPAVKWGSRRSCPPAVRASEEEWGSKSVPGTRGGPGPKLLPQPCCLCGCLPSPPLRCGAHPPTSARFLHLLAGLGAEDSGHFCCSRGLSVLSRELVFLPVPPPPPPWEVAGTSWGALPGPWPAPLPISQLRRSGPRARSF